MDECSAKFVGLELVKRGQFVVRGRVPAVVGRYAAECESGVVPPGLRSCRQYRVGIGWVAAHAQLIDVGLAVGIGILVFDRAKGVREFRCERVRTHMWK